MSEAAARAMHPDPAGPPPWFTRLVAGLPRFTDSLLGRLTPPPEARPRQSAVLALFSAGEDAGALGNGPDVLLTQRHAGLRSHAGQVAFPGGRLDPGDDGPRGAALREAQEETGLDPAGVVVAGFAPRLWIPVTNYHVTPVIAWWERPSPVSASSRGEVERVVRVPLVELADPVNRFMVVHPSGIAGPGFDVRGLFVWGFTAGVLTGLLTLGGWERRWDTSRLVPLPPQPTPAEAEAEQAVPDADADPRGVLRDEGRGHA